MTDTIKTLKSRRSCRKFDGRQITDEQLLEKKNGILQGMSGSPVIQNGNVCAHGNGKAVACYGSGSG